MEGSRKRRLTNATPTSDGSASKKLRLLNSNAPTPAKSQVQQVGEKILEQLHNATDKNGRYIATQFLTLPSRDDIPEYYDIIKLPIALDTIEEKLKRDAYPTVTTLESDFKRLVQNAKDFNDPKSEIYEDAERIRKLCFNFMKANNPAYKEDPKYTSFPTPIPQDAAQLVQNGYSRQPSVQVSTPDVKEPTPKPKIVLSRRTSEPPEKKQMSVAPSAGTGAEDDEGGDDDGGDEGGDDIDFTGKTFQEAQQMLIAYLLHYHDSEGLEVYTPFGNLPTRKLEDYYKLIRHPVSLKSVAKRARGQHGRAPPTGQTDFKTWDAFEEEVSFIWRNAQEYNEDGSDMFNLAEEFKEHFQSLLAEAKGKVQEPLNPRLKIGGPKPKVMLNLNQSRASPSAPGVSVDNEALARQRQMVQAGINGQQTAMQPQLTNGSTPALARPPSSAHSGSPVGNAVKLEQRSTQSPGPQGLAPVAQPLTNGMMPPPFRPALSNGSPMPATVQQPVYTAPASLQPTPVRPYPIEQAMLPSLTINTHPHLKTPSPYSITIPPHPTLSHQSTTLTLPSTHYFLQIQPTISKELSLTRPYRLFVTVNGTRLTQKDTVWSGEGSRRTHLYEGSLAQGVNRIEVEVVAEKKGGEGGLEVERVGVFVYLMR